MLEVSASEYELIGVTRSIVGVGRATPAALLTACKLSSPSPACQSIIRQTLASGCVQVLARGGWRSEPRIASGNRVEGRLWERHPVPKLEFTSATEKLLRWLTEHNLRLKIPLFREAPRSVADDLLFFLALEMASDAELGAILAAQPAFVSSPLCRLAFPDLFSQLPKAPRKLPDFAWLTDGLVIEALELRLSSRWQSMEAAKGRIGSSDVMVKLGTEQERVLTAFFAAIDAASRRDLCRFVLLSAAEISENASVQSLVGNLAQEVALSARMEPRAAAGAFLRSLETPTSWVNVARNAHFIDDDYAAAQILLEIWETLGDACAATLRGVCAELTSIEAITS